MVGLREGSKSLSARLTAQQIVFLPLTRSLAPSLRREGGSTVRRERVYVLPPSTLRALLLLPLKPTAVYARGSGDEEEPARFRGGAPSSRAIAAAVWILARGVRAILEDEGGGGPRTRPVSSARRLARRRGTGRLTADASPPLHAPPRPGQLIERQTRRDRGRWRS